MSSEAVICLDCGEARKKKDINSCLYCGHEGSYCERCSECKQCGESFPGYYGCGERGEHKIEKGEETGTCEECDETWRTCLRHLKTCEGCGKYLCIRSYKHQCQRCSKYVCEDCGMIPSLSKDDGGSPGGVFCKEHIGEGVDEFVTNFNQWVRPNKRLMERIMNNE